MQKNTYLITGANRGLGFHACQQLTAAGHRVILAARTLKKAQIAAEKIPSNPHQIIPIALDLTDTNAIDQLPAQLAALQITQLNGLLNNAGIFPEDQRHPTDLTPQTLTDVLQTNVVGPHALLQALIPLLLKAAENQGVASVVNTSSRLGSLEETRHGSLAGTDHLAYQTSKAALNMLTVAWANQMAETPLKINAISPGWCATDMGGSQATRTPEVGAAALVSFLQLKPDGPTGGFFDDQGPIPW